MTIIKGKNFKLRPIRDSDADSLAESINFKDIAYFLMNSPYPYNKKHAKWWINRCKKLKDEKQWVIDVHGKVVGGIGLSGINKNRAEVGYWVTPAYRGKGIATQAVRLIVNHAFKKLKLFRVQAFTFVGNEASEVVLAKNGFLNESTLKKYERKGRRSIDCLIWAKIR